METMAGVDTDVAEVLFSIILMARKELRAMIVKGESGDGGHRCRHPSGLHLHWPETAAVYGVDVAARQ